MQEDRWSLTTFNILSIAVASIFFLFLPKILEEELGELKECWEQ